MVPIPAGFLCSADWPGFMVKHYLRILPCLAFELNVAAFSRVLLFVAFIPVIGFA